MYIRLLIDIQTYNQLRQDQTVGMFLIGHQTVGMLLIGHQTVGMLLIGHQTVAMPTKTKMLILP